MKRLTILRHARARAESASSGDFGRTLNAGGREDARAAGEAMKRRGELFDQLIASPAARVRETIEEVARGFGELPEAEYDEELYMASVARLLRAVRALRDDSRQALVVGHNPGLKELVAALARPGALAARAAERFPTAALALIDLDCGSWADVRPGIGTLVELIVPGD